MTMSGYERESTVTNVIIPVDYALLYSNRGCAHPSSPIHVY